MQKIGRCDIIVGMKKSEVIKKFSPLALLAAAVIWGYAFVVVKESLDVIPPVYMMAFRFSIAAAFLAVISLPKLKKITAKTWRRGLLVGFLVYAAYLFQTIGCKYTTAGNNAFLTAVYVILVPILGAMFFRKKAGAVTYICAVIALVGIGLICLGGAISFNIGDVLTLICSIAYAVHIIFLSDYTKKEDIFVLMMVQFVFTAAFSWLSAPVFDGAIPSFQASKDSLVGMLYLGVMSSGIAYLLQSLGQKYSSAAASSILLSTESVFGAVFGVIFLNEVMTVAAGIGCAMMFIAIVISETKLAFIPKVGDFIKKIDGNES